MTVTSKWVALHEVSDYLARGWREVQIIGGCDDAALMVSPEEPASAGGNGRCDSTFLPAFSGFQEHHHCRLMAGHAGMHEAPSALGGNPVQWINLQPASEPAKVEYKNCHYSCGASIRFENGFQAEYHDCKPAQPEPVAAVGNEDCVKAKQEGPWLAKVLEPVAEEMPEAVYLAVNALRQESQYWAQNGVEVASNIFALRAKELESFWRAHAAQPAKVRMTEELGIVLGAAQGRADRHSERGDDKEANRIWNAIAALRRYDQDEYDQLKRATAQHLRWIADTLVGSFSEATESAFVLGYTARDNEIEELRARVKELEEMVPRWVGEAEHSRLLQAGWSIARPEQFWHRPPGAIEAEWHWLMVPPIPLPEG